MPGVPLLLYNCNRLFLRDDAHSEGRSFGSRILTVFVSTHAAVRTSIRGELFFAASQSRVSALLLVMIRREYFMIRLDQAFVMRVVMPSRCS